MKHGDPKFTVLVSIWIPARTFRPVDAGALLPKRWRWRWIRRGSPSMPSSRRRDRRWLVRHAGVILRAILTEYGINEYMRRIVPRDMGASRPDRDSYFHPKPGSSASTPHHLPLRAPP